LIKLFVGELEHYIDSWYLIQLAHIENYDSGESVHEHEIVVLPSNAIMQ